MFMSKKIKLLTLGLAAALSVGIIAGCGSQNAANNDKKNFKIGIVQLVEHNALDAANKGFVDGLKQRGYEEGKNITIDRQNAQADQSNLQNIGQRDKAVVIALIALYNVVQQLVQLFLADIRRLLDLLSDFLEVDSV